MFIYLDESGDLGFDFENKKPSRNFVITLLVCNNKKAADSFKTSVRRTLKNKLNHKKSNKRQVHELHAASLILPIKEYFYSQIKNQDWCIYTVVLNKQRIYNYLVTKDSRKKLYNYLAHFLLKQIDLSMANSEVTLIVDKSKSKADIENFNQFLANQFEAVLPLNVPLNISHEDSKASSGLQAVDLFCWGVYRKYEHGDIQWYQQFENKIVFETEHIRE